MNCETNLGEKQAERLYKSGQRNTEEDHAVQISL